MDLNLGTGRAPSASTVIPLALAAVLAAALAWQAVDASRSHASVARASLREQATFAASNFAREARHEVLSDLLDEGVEVVESTLGWSGQGGSRARFERVARADHWSFAPETIVFFRADLPPEWESSGSAGDFVWGGAEAPEIRAWAVAEVQRFVRTHPVDRRIQVLFAPGRSEVLAWDVASGRGRDAIHGLVLEGAAVAAAFDEAFGDEPLLPEALSSGLANDRIFLARVRAPDGRVVYASSDGPASDVVVESRLAPALGGLTLEFGVLPEGVEALVAGGVPRSRLPFVLALAGLTALLLGVAVWQLRREAELARLRADFVSGISHQLLTPLTQIRMFGETLLLGRVNNDQERARAAGIIVDEATRLSNQVESILAFSRGDGTGPDIVPAETDLGALVAEVVAGFEPMAEREHVTIRTDLETGLRATVDPAFLRQALLNLLDNALKYGRGGQILDVGVRRAADGRWATLWVEDEGPGVPERDRERIWEAYVRLEREVASGGSGIGLAVVRQAVEALGGRVRVEDSRRGQGTGSRFLIEVPLAVPTV